MGLQRQMLLLQLLLHHSQQHQHQACLRQGVVLLPGP
jgi:hypothetical protein